MRYLLINLPSIPSSPIPHLPHHFFLFLLNFFCSFVFEIIHSYSTYQPKFLIPPLTPVPPHLPCPPRSNPPPLPFRK